MGYFSVCSLLISSRLASLLFSFSSEHTSNYVGSLIRRNLHWRMRRKQKYGIGTQRGKEKREREAEERERKKRKREKSGKRERSERERAFYLGRAQGGFVADPDTAQGARCKARVCTRVECVPHHIYTHIHTHIHTHTQREQSRAQRACCMGWCEPSLIT